MTSMTISTMGLRHDIERVFGTIWLVIWTNNKNENSEEEIHSHSVCMKIFSLPCESIRGLHTFYGFLTE
jgi:hypothetical protein